MRRMIRNPIPVNPDATSNEPTISTTNGIWTAIAGLLSLYHDVVVLGASLAAHRRFLTSDCCR